MSFKVRFAQSGPKPRSMRSYYQVGRYRNMNLDFSPEYVVGFYFKKMLPYCRIKCGVLINYINWPAQTSHHLLYNVTSASTNTEQRKNLPHLIHLCHIDIRRSCECRIWWGGGGKWLELCNDLVNKWEETSEFRQRTKTFTISGLHRYMVDCSRWRAIDAPSFPPEAAQNLEEMSYENFHCGSSGR